MNGLIFLGTPAEAIPALDVVHATGDLRLVITMPDRPRGRRATLQPPPVKVRAEELRVAVAQPTSAAELDTAVAEAGPIDLGVVVAFGRIISEAAFTTPQRGMVNVHFSLLPRWRGAAPVERAILAGDTVTGVTLMEIGAGLDTGGIYAQWPTGISPQETAGQLSQRLAIAGAELLGEHLGDIRRGLRQPVPQPSAGVTHAGRIETAEARLDLSRPAEDLAVHVRAFNPRPGAYAEHDGSRFKVWRAIAAAGELPPGTLQIADDRLVVGTGRGVLELLEVQAAGGRRMAGDEWARGMHAELGSLT